MPPSASEELLDWSHRFRRGELTAEDIQDRFATIDLSDLPAELAKPVADAQRELDFIRYGMCETGQCGEITRIFCELEPLLRRAA